MKPEVYSSSQSVASIVWPGTARPDGWHPDSSFILHPSSFILHPSSSAPPLAPLPALWFITSMQRFVIWGAVNAFLAVAAGAFGAHGLKDRLGPDLLEVFETAARYHMYHALGLIAVGWVAGGRPSSAANAAGWSMLMGILLFSGSLYVLALTGQRWLGAITPLGGLGFLAGWGLLAYAASR